MSQNVVLNWSSGKDASLAFLMLQSDPEFQVTQLLTTINAEADRVFMHGTREALLDMQAERMGLPVTKVKLPPSPDDLLYKEAMNGHLTRLSLQGIHYAAYGDIFLEDLKTYREAQLAQAGFNAVFPLWKQDTAGLVELVASSGIEAIIVCVNGAVLDKEFLGRKIDRTLLQDLPPGVDPCGENGEYHTCVLNAPFFSRPIPYRTGETIFKTFDTQAKDTPWNSGFYFLDVIPE